MPFEFFNINHFHLVKLNTFFSATAVSMLEVLSQTRQVIRHLLFFSAAQLPRFRDAAFHVHKYTLVSHRHIQMIFIRH